MHRGAVVVAAFAFVGCGARTSVGGGSGGGASDGAVSTAGRPELDGAPSTRRTVCDPEDLGSALGRSVVEGTLRGPSAFQSSCGGKGPEAAFLWTAPLSGAYSLDATASEVENAITVLLPGAHCKGSELVCRATGTFLVYTATAGERVEIVVDSTGAQGGFVLTITGPALAAGASSGAPCADFDLASVLGDTVLNGLFFGGRAADPTCGFPSSGLTATWKAPRDGIFVFDTSLSSFEAAVELQGYCSGPLIACGGADGAPRSRVSASLSSGQVVMISILDLGGRALGKGYFALGISG